MAAVTGDSAQPCASQAAANSAAAALPRIRPIRPGNAIAASFLFADPCDRRCGSW
ncbi:hypothetical protein GCM10009102_16040 [Sphingomonas insulae]|uniref:Uncharacterized protein n=1 Tax=Sphingomonas insulae TaxID=424800 RepID=A0ABN1HTQ8_9SPHN